jgi:hypothetical protein
MSPAKQTASAAKQILGCIRIRNAHHGASPVCRCPSDFMVEFFCNGVRNFHGFIDYLVLFRLRLKVLFYYLCFPRSSPCEGGGDWVLKDWVCRLCCISLLFQIFKLHFGLALPFGEFRRFGIEGITFSIFVLQLLRLLFGQNLILVLNSFLRWSKL